MGRLKVIKSSALATVQDFGRYGFRQYGIPQSGAIDKQRMIQANQLVKNPDSYPVIEYAISGMILEAEAETLLSISGARLIFNEEICTSALLKKGDIAKLSKPFNNYAYLGISGQLDAQFDFNSYSTDLRAGFGGINGRVLQTGDLIITKNGQSKGKNLEIEVPEAEEISSIRIIKGPEWDCLKELPDIKVFHVDSSSDRMGIRLSGNILEADYQEIASSAVIPGTVQLPADGKPIILMNDCQTTGGYPRIGKVIDEDLSKLAQIKPSKGFRFQLLHH